jgi:ribonuclease HII
LIDGNRDPKTNIISSFELIVKGDDKSVTIGIASNVAKQYRDDSMIEIDSKYPVYDFKNNVGYGTPKHILGLKEHGFTPIHRINATQKLISDKKS